MDLTQNNFRLNIHFVPISELDIVKNENELLLIRIAELIKDKDFLQKMIHDKM